MPTSVDDLVEVAELAERLLLAAPDPDDVGELLRGPGSCGESAVGGFWHGSGREGKRAHDEVCGQGPERGGEDGSGAREGEHVAEGARGQGSNRSWPGGGGAGGARAPWRIRAMASALERDRVDAIRWVLQMGAKWRELPAEYGAPTTSWRWYERWCGDGTWQQIAAALELPPTELGREPGHRPPRAKSRRSTAPIDVEVVDQRP